MIEFLLTYVYYLIAGHLIFAFLGLLINLQTEKYLQVRDFVFAFLFGPFYFLQAAWNLDAYVIDLRKDKK